MRQNHESIISLFYKPRTWKGCCLCLSRYLERRRPGQRGQRCDINIGEFYFCLYFQILLPIFLQKYLPHEMISTLWIGLDIVNLWGLYLKAIWLCSFTWNSGIRSYRSCRPKRRNANFMESSTAAGFRFDSWQFWWHYDQRIGHSQFRKNHPIKFLWK